LLSRSVIKNFSFPNCIVFRFKFWIKVWFYISFCSQYRLSTYIKILKFAYQLFLFCLCRASERSRHSDSKVDEVLILDKRTQYFIMFRRTSRKRGLVWLVYIKTTKEDKTKVYAMHMSGEMQPNKTKAVCNSHIRINTTKQNL
jgi:hypothetical protein